MNARADWTGDWRAGMAFAGAAQRLPDPATAIPRHDAEALTQGGLQAQIVLNGQVYSLRITRAGKLILTK